MKTVAIFGFLWLALFAFGQNPAGSQPTTAKPAPGVTQSAAPAKTPDTASKTAVKVDPEKEAAIRKLFEIMGTRKSMEQVVAGILANMKPSLGQMLPPGEYQDKLIPLFFAKFQSKLKADDLMDLAIPVYDKYLSREDIDGLAQFYETPVGRKMISVLPQIVIETQTVAMSMGQDLGRKSMMEVLAEHPDLAKALGDAAAQKN